ncbi:MAG: hypothetical protein FJ291_03370 [Planctomycetes bacterium]|nr:hypothetical protein [Planctomycetota bacterium]
MARLCWRVFVYSEYGDADRDGLPNWFEMYWFGKWGDLRTATVADPKWPHPEARIRSWRPEAATLRGDWGDADVPPRGDSGAVRAGAAQRHARGAIAPMEVRRFGG